jgi:hypothetical protein
LLAFVFLLDKFVPKSGFGGYIEGIIIEAFLVLFSLVSIIIYEILRAKSKGAAKTYFDITDKKKRNIIITTLLLLIFIIFIFLAK